MIRKTLIITFLFSLSFHLYGEECNTKMKSDLKKEKSKVLECLTLTNLKDNDSSFVLVIRNENVGLKARGVGVQVFKNDGIFSSAIFEDFGLGQFLGTFIDHDKTKKLLISDFDKDGVSEFSLNVFNERSALFFMYEYSGKSKKFESVQFKRKSNESVNRLVGTLDHPLKIHNDSIQVFYEKDKSFSYKYKNGSFLEQ